MPKVSVIIVTYNRAELLGAAIMSVVNQTFEDFELVIVDDASRDGTSSVVKNFHDQRIKYICHAVNKGEAGARNTGVMNASGEYIAFLDDDDEWLPEKLALQVDLLERSSAQVGIIYTGRYTIDGASEKEIGVMIPTKKGDLSQEIRRRNFITLSSVLLRRQCFDAVGLFDENIIFGPDYDMWIRIAPMYHFDYIAMPLVKYLVHPNSLSANYDRRAKGIETTLKKHEDFFSVDKSNFSRRHFRLGITYYLTGDIQRGRTMCLKAIKIYPFELRNYVTLLWLSLFGVTGYKKLLTTKAYVATFLNGSSRFG